jgi:hypothetical protein
VLHGCSLERGHTSGDSWTDAMAGRVQQSHVSIVQLLGLVRTDGVRTKEANEEIPHGRVEGVKGERRKRQLIRLYREYLSLVD